MSGRVASHTPNRPNPRHGKSLLVFGLLLFAGLLGLAPLANLRADDDLDDRPPLPPTEPKRAALAAKYRIPNTDAAIFRGRKDPKTGKIDGGVQDFVPVATEKQNKDEYDAWNLVISHAKQFTAAELEQNAGRDLTRDDLINITRVNYRCELLRFDGKLAKVRRVPASKSLADFGTEEVYEALLVPLDEPTPADKEKVATQAVSVVFTELPTELATLKQKPVGEWMDVDSWATAAGFFFKVKQDGPNTEAVPILVGRSVTLLKAEPTAPAPDTAALDKNLRVFKFIRDDAYIAKAEDNWEEVSAWNRVLLHARRFMPAELEAQATELKFADLFLDGRRDYKLDLVKFEGRLIMLTKMKPGDKLAAAGIETVYEGWLVPANEPRGNPVCVVFTDPPEGVEATGRVNKWVSFAGYSFKLLRYKSGERDKDDPNRNVTKRAPLLIGRAVINRPDPDGPASTSWGAFMNSILGLLIGVLVLAGGLTWWFRRGDRRARMEIDAVRGKNPFADGGTQTV